jgi:hypothetical protein
MDWPLSGDNMHIEVSIFVTAKHFLVAQTEGKRNG